MPRGCRSTRCMRRRASSTTSAPTALLYLFLRHALQLGYHDVSIRLHENAGLYTPAAALQGAHRRSVPAHHADTQRSARAAISRSMPPRRRSRGSATLPVHAVHRRGSSMCSSCRALPARAAGGARAAEGAVDGPAGTRVRRSHRLLLVPSRCVAARDRELTSSR